MIPDLGAFSIVLLIFGGCCSNVFALEAIVRTVSDSGFLITFLQFAFVAVASWGTQFSPKSPYGIRPPKVPLVKWLDVAIMFFAINMLNNWAFAFSISVPVHIILRSFGSATTMLAGYLRGKQYSHLQVLSVLLLTIGVLVSAWADSERKGKSMSMGNSGSDAEFVTGIAILLAAQILAAYMGAVVEDMYTEFKPHWTENLFYSHALAIPMFLPLSSTLWRSCRTLAQTPGFELGRYREKSILRPTWTDPVLTLIEPLPQGLTYLAVNAITQLACISGVNLLAAKSSAVTVTIVLNIRKLVSFIFSTLLFQHQLTAKMVLGSALVFGGGALYGWESSWRIPQQRKRQQAGAMDTTKKSN